MKKKKNEKYDPHKALFYDFAILIEIPECMSTLACACVHQIWDIFFFLKKKESASRL